MTIETLFLLSSGLFLGWSLGANDAGNVFGTAVGSRMIRFSTAMVGFVAYLWFSEPSGVGKVFRGGWSNWVQ